ncbi:MAG: hypothetical protein OEM78_08535 [Gammaproteobacteria bacterium]|nr:hypothetical protein [Gammaproteobacteria bacterium]
MRSIAMGVLTGLTTAGLLNAQEPVPGQGFAAIPGLKGGQDISGAYEVVEGWPIDTSTLPGHEGWTMGAGEAIFPESPDRVFVLVRGEIPVLERPELKLRPEIGPSISFPINRVPWRDATYASLPGSLDEPTRPEVGIRGRLGIDARWEHCILIFNREGKLVDSWTQWDELLRRPHSLYISPYDPEKHVWITDDFRHAVFKFTNDGKELVQTIGVPDEHGDDENHFYRPTFMAWHPDGGFYVADGDGNSRVVRFDKDGNYMFQWGQRGNNGTDTRPGYMNGVHGIALDPGTNNIYVNDRNNHRIQVFSEHGEYLNEWYVGDDPSRIHLVIIDSNRNVWAYDRGTHKVIKYDLEGNFLYQFGTYGLFPGYFWGVHDMAVDQEGNFYVAEVNKGGAQKFRPRPGANPDFLVGRPVYSAWK